MWSSMTNQKARFYSTHDLCQAIRSEDSVLFFHLRYLHSTGHSLRHRCRKMLKVREVRKWSCIQCARKILTTPIFATLKRLWQAAVIKQSILFMKIYVMDDSGLCLCWYMCWQAVSSAIWPPVSQMVGGHAPPPHSYIYVRYLHFEI